MEIEAIGLSDKGLVRLENEDAYLLMPSCHFYALADGLGGRNSGEIASREAILHLSQSLEKKKTAESILTGIQEANLKIWEMAQTNESHTGMGTTLSCIFFHDHSCFLANVGDSRIYRLRDDELQQLTQDDSLVFELVQFGLLDEQEAKTFPLKHVITKSLGGIPLIEPSISKTDVQPGDFFLLCSDGLYNPVDDATMKQILLSTNDLQQACEKMIRKALDLGGLDNITVILIHVT